MKQIYTEKNQKTINSLHNRELGSTTFNIFLIQNMGKGPPGLAGGSGKTPTPCPNNSERLVNLIYNSSILATQFYKEQTFNYLLINKSIQSLIF